MPLSRSTDAVAFDAGRTARHRRAGCRGTPALDPVRGGARPRGRPDRLPARRPGHRRRSRLEPATAGPVGGADPDRLAGRPPRRTRDPRPGPPDGVASLDRAGRRAVDRRAPSTSRTTRGRGIGAIASSAMRPGPAAATGRQRRHRHDPGRRQPDRAPPRDLRLPAVLGGQRVEPPPRLRPDLDDRLLRDRRGRGGQPPEAQPRRLDHGRLERLDQLAPDEHHLGRPPQPHPGRPHGPELRLEHVRPEPPEAASSAPRRPGPTSPARSRPRSAIAAPTASTSTSSRSPAATRASSPRSSAAIRAAAQPGPPRLPGDVRHARLDRQLPDRGRDRGRRRRRDLHHGLRLPDRRRSSPVGSVAPLSRTGYDVRDTSPPTPSRVPPSKLILGVPVLRPGLVDAQRAPSTRRTPARPGPAPRRPSSTTPPPTTSPSTAASTTRREQVAWTAYRRQNCTSTTAA